MKFGFKEAGVALGFGEMFTESRALPFRLAFSNWASTFDLEKSPVLR